MKKIILLFSHQLNELQIKELKETWDVGEFSALPQNIQNLWSNISPDLKSLQTLLEPLEKFLQQEANKDDLVLIQGDFGASYSMVNFAKSLNLVPVYATTTRTIKEKIIDGKTVKQSIFEHRRFRKYE